MKIQPSVDTSAMLPPIGPAVSPRVRGVQRPFDGGGFVTFGSPTKEAL
jgi:hypothetical protein